MKAEVYYDDLGKDYREEEIPAEMMEDAQLYGGMERGKHLSALNGINGMIMLKKKEAG